MSSQQTTSLSYLLRLWPTDTAGRQVWRASLEQVQTSERLGFATLEQLFVFLMQQTEYHSAAPDTQPQSAPLDSDGQASKGTLS
jgi:hypothetical protein